MALRLDALLLRGMASELQRALAGAAVRKISQLNETDLLITLYRAGETLRLLICLSAEEARVHLVGQERPIAQTPGAFCMLLRKHLDGARIQAVRTWGSERVLQVAARRADVNLLLALELTVLERNLLLAADGQIMGTWHRPGQQSMLVRNVHEAAVDSLIEPLPQLPSGSVGPILIGSIFGLNRQAAAEIAAGAGAHPDDAVGDVSRAALESAWDDFRQHLVEGRFQPVWCPGLRLAAPWPYRSWQAKETIQYESFSIMFDTLLGHGWVDRQVGDRRQALMDRLQKQRSRLERRLQAQRENLVALADTERWQRQGQLLLSATGAASRSGEVAVLDYEQSPPARLLVTVDPRFTVSENAQMCFNRYKKGLRGRVALARQLERGDTEVRWLEELEVAARDARNLAELQEVADLVRGTEPGPVEQRRNRTGSTRRRPPIRSYRIEGHQILVGCNPRQNDELTLRLADPDDVWLHARQIPGAHVLIRRPGTSIPDAVLLAAATLAAVHSKATGKVAVDYTRARYVRKPPQAPLGLVTYRQEKTVVVRADAEAVAKLGLVQD